MMFAPSPEYLRHSVSGIVSVGDSPCSVFLSLFYENRVLFAPAIGLSRVDASSTRDNRRKFSRGEMEKAGSD